MAALYIIKFAEKFLIKQATSNSAAANAYRWRFYAIFFFLLLGVIGLVMRMVHLSVFDRAFLMEQSKSRVLRFVDIPALVRFS